MLLAEYDPPISSEAYAYARASLISRSFRDRIATIETDDVELDDELFQAYALLDNLGATCCDRALEGDADPEEVAEVYRSDTLGLLAGALREASGGYEFQDETAQLYSISLLIAGATS